MRWFSCDALIFCNNFMLPKRRFWKELQKMKCGFLIDFLMARSPNRVLTPEEKGIENTHFIFCNPFQNRLLGGIKLRNFCSLHWHWSDAMRSIHMIRCCFSLYKQDQSVYKPRHVVQCDAMHMVPCDAATGPPGPSKDFECATDDSSNPAHPNACIVRNLFCNQSHGWRSPRLAAHRIASRCSSSIIHNKGCGNHLQSR